MFFKKKKKFVPDTKNLHGDRKVHKVPGVDDWTGYVSPVSYEVICVENHENGKDWKYESWSESQTEDALKRHYDYYEQLRRKHYNL